MKTKEYKNIMEYLKKCEDVAFNKQITAAGNKQTEEANKEFLMVHKIMKIIKNKAEDENIIINIDPLIITDENINNENIELINWRDLPGELENRFYNFIYEQRSADMDYDLIDLLKYASKYEINYNGYGYSYIKFNAWDHDNMEWINEDCIKECLYFIDYYSSRMFLDPGLKNFIDNINVYQHRLDLLYEAYYYYNTFPADQYDEEWEYTINLIDNITEKIECFYDQLASFIINIIHKNFNDIYDTMYEDITDYCYSNDNYDLFSGYRYNKEKGLYKA